jgi:signal transduction histidine kinase
MSKIFEPFFSTKEDQHRTGLGLAIAKNILDRHGAALEVYSTPGKGAEFIVTLPLLALQPNSSPNGAPATEGALFNPISANQVAHV